MDSKREYVCSPKDARPISYSSPISDGSSSSTTLTAEFETIEIEDDESEIGKICCFENINSVPIAIDSPPISVIMKNRPEDGIGTNIRTLNKVIQTTNLQTIDKTKMNNSIILPSTSQILVPNGLHQQSSMVKSNQMIVISTITNPEAPQNYVKTNEGELVKKMMNCPCKKINSSGTKYDPIESQKNYHKTMGKEIGAVKSTPSHKKKKTLVIPKQIHVESQKSYATEKIVKERMAGKSSHSDMNNTAVFPKQSLVESQGSYVTERRDEDGMGINLMKKKASAQKLVGSKNVTPKQILVQERSFLPDPGDITVCGSHDINLGDQQNEKDPLYIPEQGQITFASGSSDSRMRESKYSHFPSKTSKKNVKGEKSTSLSSGVKKNTTMTNSSDKKPPSKVTSERKYIVKKNSCEVPPVKSSTKLRTSSKVKDSGVGKVEEFVESSHEEHSIVQSYSIQNRFNEISKKNNEISKKKQKKPKQTNPKTVNQNQTKYSKSSDCCRNFFIKNSAWDYLEYTFRGFNEREKNISATCFDYFVQLWTRVGENQSLVDHDYFNQLYYTRRIEVLDSRGYLDKVISPHEGKRKREIPYVLPPTKKCKIVLERNEIVEETVKDFQLNEKLSTFVSDKLVFSVEDENKPLIISNKSNINVSNVTEKLAKHSNVSYVTDREKFPEKLLKNSVLVESIQEKVVKSVTPKASKKMFS